MSTFNPDEAVEQLRSKIGRYLRSDRIPYEVRTDGDYGIWHGSTMVLIHPRVWGDMTLVQVVAPVVREVSKITPQLTRFLAERNNEMLFGKFGLDVEAKTIWCEHALLGDFLDPDELLMAVQGVANAADDVDETIAKMAEGKRAIDVEM